MLLCLLMGLAANEASGQRLLQIETYGKAKTKKIFIGEQITYAQTGMEGWHTSYIEDILPAQGRLALSDRYLVVSNITALRYRSAWPGVGTSLMTFGTAWAGYALIGYTFDGNPETNFSALDAVVGGTSILAGLAMRRFLKYKTIKIGKRKRLRLLDLTF